MPSLELDPAFPEAVSNNGKEDTMPTEAAIRDTTLIPLTPWSVWDGGGDTIIYESDDVPLQETGVVLGRGGFADIVDKVVCKGIEIARKTIRTDPSKLTTSIAMQEISILKRLSHQHIIKLVGSYIIKSDSGRDVVGILLTPVAVCDLAKFLEVASRKPQGRDEGEFWEQFQPWKPRHLSRFSHFPNEDNIGDLPLDCSHEWPLGLIMAYSRLRHMIGCLSNALTYIHDQGGIVCKDIKPANILVTRENVLFTDFGSSRDVSKQIHSSGYTKTIGDPEGTARYYAPEVQDSAPHGRSADVFSLGCVYLEILTITYGHTLAYSDSKISGRGNSDVLFQYHRFLPNVHQWITILRQKNQFHRTILRSGTLGWCWSCLQPCLRPWDRHYPFEVPGKFESVFSLIEEMLAEGEDKRPKMEEVSRRLYLYSGTLQVFHESHWPPTPRCCAMKHDSYCCGEDQANGSSKPQTEPPATTNISLEILPDPFFSCLSNVVCDEITLFIAFMPCFSFFGSAIFLHYQDFEDWDIRQIVGSTWPTHVPIPFKYHLSMLINFTILYIIDIQFDVASAAKLFYVATHNIITTVWPIVWDYGKLSRDTIAQCLDFVQRNGFINSVKYATAKWIQSSLTTLTASTLLEESATPILFTLTTMFWSLNWYFCWCGIILCLFGIGWIEADEIDNKDKALEGRSLILFMAMVCCYLFAYGYWMVWERIVVTSWFICWSFTVVFGMAIVYIPFDKETAPGDRLGYAIFFLY